MTHPADPPRLFVSHDRTLHRLVAIEFGRVAEDQAPDLWCGLTETCAFLLDAPGGRPVGFRIDDLLSFDADDPDVAAIWDPPHFHAPVLGLSAATVGEIVLAARRHFGERNSIDCTLAALATSCTGHEAVARWTHCLEAGDASAHFPLGCTLLDLGRPEQHARDGEDHQPGLRRRVSSRTRRGRHAGPRRRVAGRSRRRSRCPPRRA